jgi:hypothetical protein
MDFNNAYRILINRVNEEIADNASSYPENTPPSVVEELSDVLNKGIIYSESTPGVPGLENYILGSTEVYLKYSEASNSTSAYSIYTSVETYLKALEALGVPPSRNSRSFMPSVEKILDINKHDSYVTDKGIMESGDYTLIRLFITEANTWSNAFGIDYQELSTNLFNDVAIDMGIVIGKYTRDIEGVLYNEVIIASVETYLKWLEVVSDQQAESDMGDQLN